jgi:IS30 family transposase
MPRTRGQAPERSGEPIDIAQAWKLRVVNKLSFGEIAKQLGCSKSTVHAALQRLNDLVPDPHVVNAYEGVEAQLTDCRQSETVALPNGRRGHRKGQLE